ncbi:glycosyltransferase family 9 protein [Brevundimonas sp. 2R-24]|uniref:Glycosyltransferase family 9 protein n=1 Tax=Peiella sedimenti TaxID=3061083 RepID=A0ABT8SJW5_9CAUL|nr:glycosyltransferase family 9 protein [Caulobacteraceae bacterium XZ-24]
MAEAADPAVRRVLFITNTRIGDAILTSGVMEALHGRWPKARFTVAAGPASAPLFAETPFVERVIVMKKAKMAGHWFRLWRETVGVRWDAVVDLRGSGVSAFLRARRRLIRRGEKGGEPRHKVIEAAGLLGLESDPPSPRIHVSEATRAKALSVIPRDRPLLALSPSANRVGKTWPIARFEAWLRAARASGGPLEGWTVAVLGGPGEGAAYQRLSQAIEAGRAVDLTGWPLLDTVAVLEACDLFVGNDSGLMHLAAASGAPVLALFGPTDERLYGPWSDRARVVRAEGQVYTFGRTSQTVSETECQMDALSVEQVLRATREAVAAFPPG